MLYRIKKIILDFLRFFVPINKGQCFFFPHRGFYNADKASVKNYKSDNCLVFVRYILDNNLYNDKILYILSGNKDKIEYEENYVQNNYPDADIRFVPDIQKCGTFDKYRTLFKIWQSEYLFTAEPHLNYQKKRGQKYICLSYYPIGLKNDYFEPKDKYFMSLIEDSKKLDVIVSNSLVNSQIDSSSTGVPFGKFKSLGKCRSDMLLENIDVTWVREYFQGLVNYPIKHLMLYVPTHRDYEQNAFDISRSILGFDVEKSIFEKFLVDNGVAIVCKLHPKQNAAIISNVLPDGVINFRGHEDFGLVELMKCSDAMITDYTSAYVDYLLLEKPVLFNFYDIDVYKRERGLAFEPFSIICDGFVFTDEQSFYEATNKSFSEFKVTPRRQQIVDFLCTYRHDVRKNTYDYVFKG